MFRPSGSSNLGNDNTLTVGRGGTFQTVAAALAYVGNQNDCFTDTGWGTFTATAWTNDTSAVTVSAIGNSASNYQPDTRTWFKIAGDTYYYPLESSSGFATGAGTLYSGIKRHESGNLTGTPTGTFYREKNYTILIIDPYYSETVTVSSLAPNLSVTLASLNGALIDLNGAGTSTWVNGRLRYQNVTLHHNGEISPLWLSNAFTSVIVDFKYSELSTAQADFFSPTNTYAGAVNMEFCTVNSFYNSSRGHMMNFVTKGDQRFRNVTWNVFNNAAIASAALSNAWFVDRFYCRHLFLENVNGLLRDPHGDFGIATMVGAGVTTAATIGSASFADYISINNCAMMMRDAATATMKINILSLQDSLGSYQGGVVDLFNSGVVAPRGTSTRKLVEALANPAAAVTVNHSNPLNQTRDVQANITYAAIT